MDDNKVLRSEENLSLGTKFSADKREQLPTQAKPTPMDYFKSAKGLAYVTGGAILVIFLLISISEWNEKNCMTDTLLSIVKDFLYPFLTLMVGYMFGKGFPSDKE